MNEPRAGRQNTARLLVAEDDGAMRAGLARFLRSRDYDVVEAEDGPAALHAVATDGVDLVILDLGLPGIGGTEVLATLKQRGNVPVIICSGQGGEGARIAGLDLGADDYLAKPFSLPELEARIRAVLRRGVPQTRQDVISSGPLRIDRARRAVQLNGRPVDLRKKEFDLLITLACAPGRVYTHLELLADVWGSTEEWQARATITEHVRRIRQKIEDDPEHPTIIETVRGVGYRFGPPTDSDDGS
jgi:DNA-binding response OmpR family regulator